MPDATKSLAGSPNGIELTGVATEHVNFDFTGGVPPEEELEAGQKVSFGAVTYGMVDDQTLRCKEDGVSFTIKGDDRDIEIGGDDAATTAVTTSQRRQRFLRQGLHPMTASKTLIRGICGCRAERTPFYARTV